MTESVVPVDLGVRWEPNAPDAKLLHKGHFILPMKEWTVEVIAVGISVHRLTEAEALEHLDRLPLR